jgi:hypothetical protein
MTPLPPSRAPQTLRPALPTMFTLLPRRNIRRADYLRRLRILEAVATWTAVAALAWFLLTH